MKENLLSALRAILEASPDPPSTVDADAVDILIIAQAMATARMAPLQRLKELLGDSHTLPEECKPLLALLQDRDARWEAALKQARHVISQRLVTLQRIRQVIRNDDH